MPETDVEKLKKQLFYEDPEPLDWEEEEVITCAEGFTDQDYCEPETRYGIEYCEWLCPWHLLSKSEELKRKK